MGCGYPPTLGMLAGLPWVERPPVETLFLRGDLVTPVHGCSLAETLNELGELSAFRQRGESP